METNNSNVLLSRFISQEIGEVYKKYSNIGEEEATLVSSFIEEIERAQIDFDPYLNYQDTKALAKALENEASIDLIQMYVFMKTDIKIQVDLEQVKDLYTKLKHQDYGQVDRYIFYNSQGEYKLEELSAEILAEELEDADKVEEIFDKDEIANLWVFNTSKDEAAKQYIEDYGWFKALDIEDLGEAYTSKNNSQVIYYCFNEGRDTIE